MSRLVSLRGEGPIPTDLRPCSQGLGEGLLRACLASPLIPRLGAEVWGGARSGGVFCSWVTAWESWACAHAQAPWGLLRLQHGLGPWAETPTPFRLSWPLPLWQREGFMGCLGGGGGGAEEGWRERGRERWSRG